MLRSIFWKPYSRLLIVGDNAGWSVDDDAKDLKNFARKLGIEAHVVRRTPLNIPQAVHYTSQFSLTFDIYKPKHRISIDYYHGRPETQGSFKKCFEALKKNHEKVTRVRVSNKEMERLIKSSGIAPEKVMRIPLGIDLGIFKPRTREKRVVMREKLGIPQEAYTIGSFQKDGTGWDDGAEPKLIKGPDTFLKVIGGMKKEIPNLWVLLSGPARGYVKNGLDKMGVPYRHQYLKDSSGVTELYDALDLYIVTSREEGGPKAILESMAKGVPLITTAVGQAVDLVVDGQNAMITPTQDVAGLSKKALEIWRDNALREALINRGFETARENSFESQLPLWQQYFRGLIAG